MYGTFARYSSSQNTRRSNSLRSYVNVQFKNEWTTIYKTRAVHCIEIGRASILVHSAHQYVVSEIGNLKVTHKQQGQVWNDKDIRVEKAIKKPPASWKMRSCKIFLTYRPLEVRKYNFVEVSGHNLEISDLKFLPSVLPFYKMLFMNKLVFSSYVDCCVEDAAFWAVHQLVAIPGWLR